MRVCTLVANISGFFSGTKRCHIFESKNAKNAIIYAQRQFLFPSLREGCAREGRGERRMFHYKIYAKEKEKGKKDPSLKNGKEGREKMHEIDLPPCFIFRKIKKGGHRCRRRRRSRIKKFPFSRKLLSCGIFGGTY